MVVTSRHLEDGDKRPQEAVEILALTDATVAATVVSRCVRYLVTELTAEQIHSQNTARTDTHKQWRSGSVVGQINEVNLR